MTDQQMIEETAKAVGKLDEIAANPGKGILLIVPMLSLLVILTKLVNALVGDNIKTKAALRSRGSKI